MNYILSIFFLSFLKSTIEQDPSNGQGNPGSIPVVSLKGIKGKQGSTGPKPLSNDPGDQGYTGLAGNGGLGGQPGLRGEEGQQGEKGPETQGDKGQKGENGLQGESYNGPKGIEGVDGKKGNTGEKGVKGQRGLPLNAIEIFANQMILQNLITIKGLGRNQLCLNECFSSRCLSVLKNDIECNSDTLITNIINDKKTTKAKITILNKSSISSISLDILVDGILLEEAVTLVNKYSNVPIKLKNYRLMQKVHHVLTAFPAGQHNLIIEITIPKGTKIAIKDLKFDEIMTPGPSYTDRASTLIKNLTNFNKETGTTKDGGIYCVSTCNHQHLCNIGKKEVQCEPSSGPVKWFGSYDQPSELKLETVLLSPRVSYEIVVQYKVLSYSTKRLENARLNFEILTKTKFILYRFNLTASSSLQNFAHDFELLSSDELELVFKLNAGYQFQLAKFEVKSANLLYDGTNFPFAYSYDQIKKFTILAQRNIIHFSNFIASNNKKCIEAPIGHACKDLYDNEQRYVESREEIQVYNEELDTSTILLAAVNDPKELVIGYTLECKRKGNTAMLKVYGSEIVVNEDGSGEEIKYTLFSEYTLHETKTMIYAKTGFYPYNQRTKLEFETELCLLVVNGLDSGTSMASANNVYVNLMKKHSEPSRSTFHTNHFYFLLLLVPVALIIGFVVHKIRK